MRVDVDRTLGNVNHSQPNTVNVAKLVFVLADKKSILTVMQKIGIISISDSRSVLASFRNQIDGDQI